MSTYKVEVIKVLPEHLKKHPNADTLYICNVKGEVGGWQCIVRYEEFKKVIDDKIPMLAAYIPVGMVMPAKEEWLFLEPRKYRVRTIKLRGEYSQGIIHPVTNPEWKEGQDVTEEIGAKKYEPPQPLVLREKGPRIPQFSGNWFQRTWKKYKWLFRQWWYGTQSIKEPPEMSYHTDIDRIQHFAKIFDEKFKDGLQCVMHEKIHGTNARFGLIDGKLWVGSHYCIKRYPMGTTLYAEMAEKLGIEKSLKELAKTLKCKSIILYGEIYGKKVQNLEYGLETQDFILFDVQVDGIFENWDVVVARALALNLKTAPELYRGDFKWEILDRAAEGNTVLGNGIHMREGVVVRPLMETKAAGLPGDRLWGKKISKAYDEAKGHQELPDAGGQADQ